MSDSSVQSDPSVCQVRIEEAGPEGFVVSVPHTDYMLRLHLKSGPKGEERLTAAAGKRVSGVISGQAQKFSRARAGGEFIEPVEGHPRIVQGRVRATDVSANRVLVQAVVPMWVTPAPGQTAGEFRAGDFVNFYMESGVAFAPTA